MMKIIIKFFRYLVLIVIVAVAAWNMNVSSKTDGILSDVMLSNIEALATNEDEGTARGTCYTNLIKKENTNCFMVPCDTRTNGSMIYPCLNTIEVKAGVTYDTDSCTK